MIDIEGLAAFLAIADAQGFSRAADKLGVAQSVVSKRLKRLEDQLGADLMDRTVRNRVKLTRMGESYLPTARAAMVQLQQAERVGRNLARGTAGPLRIGAIFSAAMTGVLGAVLSALARDLPDVTVDLQMMETPEQLAALGEGRLDIGLVRPRLAFPSVCKALRVHREPLVVGMPADHPLAAFAALSPEALQGQRFIIPQFREKVGLAENLERLCAAGGFMAGEIVRTADFVTAAALAASGHGIVLAPASLRNIGLANIAFRDIAGFDDRIETVLLYRDDAPARAVESILRADLPMREGWQI
ncbi:LysR family transcriptional regulator [Novosphingobium sp. PASSN1]|uniref:LysR family transcriptional regulator n=1 Tax=Novosphingobium sp. PASSN1 TaxID=2015561 RepID=UPI000BDC66C4|nr:LysR family transcriptional regulator [Novosphingobium sp. PASSN1]OYU34498.1 MAG: LysR family transcriptional regulator [Novosphingobium sp. PASSN1]